MTTAVVALTVNLVLKVMMGSFVVSIVCAALDELKGAGQAVRVVNYHLRGAPSDATASIKLATAVAVLP